MANFLGYFLCWNLGGEFIVAKTLCFIKELNKTLVAKTLDFSKEFNKTLDLNITLVVKTLYFSKAIDRSRKNLRFH